MRNPSRGEIWFINLNPTLGREQSGMRPVLVISVNGFNNSAADLAVILPVTSKKRKIPLHVQILPPEGGLKTESFIKCEDIRSVSKERFTNFLGTVGEKTLDEVENKLKLLLGL